MTPAGFTERWARPFRPVVDTVVVLTVLALTVGSRFRSGGTSWTTAQRNNVFYRWVAGDENAPTGAQLWCFLLLALLVSLSTLLRRRFPIAAVAIWWCVWVVGGFTGAGAGAFVVALIPTMHGLGISASGRAAVVVAALAVATTAAADLLASGWEQVNLSFVPVIAAYLRGAVVRVRREQILSLERRVELVDEIAALRAEQAVMEDRARIAREMHDVSAHGMSVVVIQAGAARRAVHSDPRAAAEVLATIEDVGRQTLADLRRVVGVLAGDASADSVSGLRPQPGLEDLPQLIETLRGAGLTVEVAMDVQTTLTLTAAMQLTLYRIIQESLTNALKYSESRSVRIDLNVEPARVHLRVVDGASGVAALPVAVVEGHAHTGAHTEADVGHGLRGMRERVLMFGGSIEVGMMPGVGFVVDAEIPIESPPLGGDPECGVGGPEEHR